MLRLLCIIFPPLAVLLVGKPITALLNVLLTILLWIPGVIHAWGVVTDAKADKRMERQVKLQSQYNKDNSHS